VKHSIAFVVIAWALGLSAAFPVELIKSGDFSPARKGQFESSPEGKVLVLPRPGPSCFWKIRLDPSWAAVRLRGEIRVTDVPLCELGWQNGRFAMEWRDDRGKTVTPWPRNDGFSGTTDWKAVDYVNAIPTNAKWLCLNLCNLSTGGEVRFRNVSLVVTRSRAARPCNAGLPEGASSDAESLDGAWSVTTPTRTRLSLNGLWRVRPSLEGEGDGFVPGPNDNWGWDKIPEVWPEWGPFVASDRISPWFEDRPEEQRRFRKDRAWYGRTVRFPKVAADKRVVLSFDMIASRAVVYVDGHRAGEAAFPTGEVDLTPFVRQGEEQQLTMDVTAYPDGETLNYNEATRANKEAKIVKFKGVTGDLWLDLLPKGERIIGVYAETSVERGEITFCAELEGAKGNRRFVAEIEGCGETRRFSGEAVAGTDEVWRFTAPWKDAKLWDTHTPQNRYTCRLSLLDAQGRTVDAALPFVFGFREVKVVGRDLYLNGTKIHLRALYNNTNNTRWQTPTKRNATAFCRNVMNYGFNFIIAGNYGFSAGDVTYTAGLLEACDETGMLYSYTLPHFKDFLPFEKPENQCAYRETVRKLLRTMRNHPSVITYANTHNTAGYLGAGHPQRIDGIYELPISANGQNRSRARIARKIIGELDATRPAYHHESGNLDDFHTVNCYLNWSPVQERSEWLEHWATVGVKPLFFVEWGMPHVSSWSSYRGPLFIWRGTGYMSLWSAEFAAAFRNDLAYETTPEMRKALAHEEQLWASGKPFAWVRLVEDCRAISNNYAGVQATMMDDNWRSFRGWGITAMLPWDQESFFDYRPSKNGKAKSRTWKDLKRPGYAGPDRVQFADPEVCHPTAVGRVMRRWNAADCAWIAGDGKFTDKRHLFRPGECVKKMLMIINDRRVGQTVGWRVACDEVVRTGKVTVAPGETARVPVAFEAGEPGDHMLRASFAFDGGVVQEDTFTYTSLKPAATPKGSNLLYDPKGLTAANLTRLGVAFEKIDSLDSVDIWKGKPDLKKRLLIGREALEPAAFRRVLTPFAERGGRVLVFEQDKCTLESIGFRVQTYGLRNAWPRFRKNPLADFMTVSNLRDWAGESTLVPGYTPLRDVETMAGRDTWCGFEQMRVWRNGNRGAVATVLPEKPSYGDWCALADGAFDLQYAPLLEGRFGSGAVTFCQFDVTGRTEPDPAADDLVRRVMAALDGPLPQNKIAYPRGVQAYASAGVRGSWIIEYNEKKAPTSRFLITDGADGIPDGFHENIRKGGVALLCGLSAAEVKKWSPVPIACVETNACAYSRIERLPPELNGLSNGDWAWHGLMDFAAFTETSPDGNAAFRIVPYGKGKLVFWQVPPWKFDTVAKPYLRISKRHAETMLSRLMGNLGFNRRLPNQFYADVPQETDDPYRYYHW